MSKNDMLGPIVRALVSVPQERMGVLLDTVNKVGGADGERWRTRLAEVLREGMQPKILSPEAPLDTIIRVDRSIRPVYPDFVKRVMHPKFEFTGPAEYYLGTIDHWLHGDQKNGRGIEYIKIYQYLKEKKMLANCLSLRDGEEIAGKGLDVFQKFFIDKKVYLWKSVVQARDGGLLNVPVLHEYDGMLVVSWHPLVGYLLLSRDITPCIPRDSESCMDFLGS